MTPRTLGNSDYEQEALVIERLTRIEVTLEKHIDDETQTLNELKAAIDTLKDAHAQARGGARLLAVIILALSAVGGIYAWFKSYIVFR